MKKLLVLCLLLSSSASFAIEDDRPEEVVVEADPIMPPIPGATTIGGMMPGGALATHGGSSGSTESKGSGSAVKKATKEKGKLAKEETKKQKKDDKSVWQSLFGWFTNKYEAMAQASNNAFDFFRDFSVVKTQTIDEQYEELDSDGNVIKRGSRKECNSLNINDHSEKSPTCTEIKLQYYTDTDNLNGPQKYLFTISQVKILYKPGTPGADKDGYVSEVIGNNSLSFVIHDENDIAEALNSIRDM